MTRPVDVQERASSSLWDRYKAISESVRRTSDSAGKNSSSASVLAVSKTRSINDIGALAQMGQTDFGENYVSEAIPKILEFSSHSLNWHFIGTVQSNKTKPIAQHFDWVQSVDREHIALRLNEARRTCSATGPLNVCIQVNIDDESTKSGVSIGFLPDLVQRVQEMPYLRLRGLMAIPRMQSNPENSRSAFSNLYELFQSLKPAASDCWDTLSMGMTSDYQIAIEEGSTMVRLGTALFGPRA